MNVELIRENADGSADYMFNLSPESVAAFARLGIMTALQAAVDGAKRYEPDEPDEPDYQEPPETPMDANIRRLAVEAGFIAWDEEEWHPAGVVFDWAGADDESLIKFYHLVRKEAIAREREACAAACENNQGSWTESLWNDACNKCAEVIRGRFAE